MVAILVLVESLLQFICPSVNEYSKRVAILVLVESLLQFMGLLKIIMTLYGRNPCFSGISFAIKPGHAYSFRSNKSQSLF